MRAALFQAKSASGFVVHRRARTGTRSTPDALDTDALDTDALDTDALEAV
jgi:hypothetical protein